MPEDEIKQEEGGADNPAQSSLPTVCKLCATSFDDRQTFDVHQCNGLIDVTQPPPVARAKEPVNGFK